MDRQRRLGEEVWASVVEQRKKYEQIRPVSPETMRLLGKEVEKRIAAAMPRAVKPKGDIDLSSVPTVAEGSERTPSR